MQVAKENLLSQSNRPHSSPHPRRETARPTQSQSFLWSAAGPGCSEGVDLQKEELTGKKERRGEQAKITHRVPQGILAFTHAREA